jgi:glutamine amidotransferase
MCIIISNEAGKIIPKDHLVQSFEHNDDGAGFAWAENDELHIEKGFMTFADFWNAYEPHQGKASVVHFRITTHGDTDVANTHPFLVGKNLAFAHNGIINAIQRPDITKSDTYWFNQKILVPIYKRDSRFIFKEPFKELIKEYIGYSKLVFLNNKGHSTIINEDKGVWDNGIWYSNTSYKPRVVHTSHAQQIKPHTEPTVFTVGSRVNVVYDYNKQLNGAGTLEYFTGGQMVGVKMDGAEYTRLVHLSFVFPVVIDNPFKVDDWVVRTDGLMKDKIGEVKGLVGDSVIIHWLNDDGKFTGPNYVIKADKLEQWWSTGLESM